MEPSRIQATDSESRRRLLLSCVLVVAVLATFGGAIGNGWILLDDPDYVFKNAHVLAGLSWDGFVWAWSGAHAGNWHPLTTLTHMLDVQVFGVNPAAHHAVNVVLHALAAVLAFVTLTRFTRSLWASFVVALLFAIHPLRVESVVWISERKDVLSGVFFWATLLAYKRWTESPGALRYVLLFLAFAAGLMSKPMLVTLPFLLLLLDVWPLARGGWRWREKIPLAALSVISCVVTYVVQRGEGAMTTAQGISFMQRLANAPVALVRYLGKHIWPTDLSAYYPFDLFESALLPVDAAIIIGIITYAVWTWRKQRPWLSVGWCWFIGMLVPVLGLVQVGGQSMADRYSYLPSVGLALMVVMSARELIERRPAWRAPLMGLAVIASLLLAWTAGAQALRWKDSRTLAEHMLQVADGRNALAHQILANAVIDSDPQLAREHLTAALALVPKLPNAHLGLGVLLSRENRIEEAISAFRAELGVRESVLAYHNLGLALIRTGKADEAAKAFESALRLDPRFRATLLQLGTLYGLTQRLADSAAIFEKLLVIDANDVDALRGLGTVASMRGDDATALAYNERLIAIAPNDANALLTLAWIRSVQADPKLRNLEKARTAADRARALIGDEHHILSLIYAVLHAEEGRFQEAVRAAERSRAQALASNDPAFTARVDLHLASYRAGHVYRP
ncbi:MAG: tetratricopeptide repeat protein [Planctomycetes bacterium]|nr:tetratricopeptide repeat protein [Planctomycetota bacterium]